jgi:predicted DsbA family dithiol-disulfide isomerase
VGKRRLEDALAMTPDLEIDLRWRPFQLDATIPPGGISREEYVNRKFGPERAKEIYDRIRGVGAEVGIPFAFEKITRSPNTLDAHRVLRWALEAGCQEMLKERLLKLYFVEGADVGDHDVLARAAADCGMDAQAVRTRLATDEDVDAVRADIDAAQRMGCVRWTWRRCAAAAAPQGRRVSWPLEQARSERPGRWSTRLQCCQRALGGWRACGWVMRPERPCRPGGGP